MILLKHSIKKHLNSANAYHILLGPVDIIYVQCSNGTIFRVIGPLCGEFTDPGKFPAQWPVTRSFNVFFDLRLNKRLSK